MNWNEHATSAAAKTSHSNRDASDVTEGNCARTSPLHATSTAKYTLCRCSFFKYTVSKHTVSAGPSALLNRWMLGGSTVAVWNVRQKPSTTNAERTPSHETSILRGKCSRPSDPSIGRSQATVAMQENA
eukprot:6175814-Pleurochrysis_carterae.AAC.1